MKKLSLFEKFMGMQEDVIDKNVDNGEIFENIDITEQVHYYDYDEWKKDVKYYFPKAEIEEDNYGKVIALAYVGRGDLMKIAEFMPSGSWGWINDAQSKKRK